MYFHLHLWQHLQQKSNRIVETGVTFLPPWPYTRFFFFSRAAVYFGFESFVCNCWSCTGLKSFLPFFTQCADKLSISISIKGIQRRLVLLRAWGFSSHDRRDRVWDILYLVRKELYGKQSLLKKKKKQWITFLTLPSNRPRYKSTFAIMQCYLDAQIAWH